MLLEQALAPACVSQDCTITLAQEIAVSHSVFRWQVADRRWISITLAIQQLKSLSVLLIAEAQLRRSSPAYETTPGLLNADMQRRIQRVLLASSNRTSYLDSDEVTVRINSTNPATMPRISPTRYSHVVCSQWSSPVPISQPANVAAGKIKASWLYLASCTRTLFFPVLSSPEGMVLVSGHRCHVSGVPSAEGVLEVSRPCSTH